MNTTADVLISAAGSAGLATSVDGRTRAPDDTDGRRVAAGHAFTLGLDG